MTPFRLTGHAISEIMPYFIKKIFILGKVNDYFIQITC